jgi:hypothetical protein
MLKGMPLFDYRGCYVALKIATQNQSCTSITNMVFTLGKTLVTAYGVLTDYKAHADLRTFDLVLTLSLGRVYQNSIT